KLRRCKFETTTQSCVNSFTMFLDQMSYSLYIIKIRKLLFTPSHSYTRFDMESEHDSLFGRASIFFKLASWLKNHACAGIHVKSTLFLLQSYNTHFLAF